MCCINSTDSTHETSAIIIVDHAGFSASTRQHELDHTDNTDHIRTYHEGRIDDLSGLSDECTIKLCPIYPFFLDRSPVCFVFPLNGTAASKGLLW